MARSEIIKLKTNRKSQPNSDWPLRNKINLLPAVFLCPVFWN